MFMPLYILSLVVIVIRLKWLHHALWMAGAFLSSCYPLLSAITSYCQLPKWKVEPMTGGTIPVNLVQLATSTGFRSEVSPGYLALVDTALPSTLSQHTYCNTQDLRFVSSAFRASSPCLVWAILLSLLELMGNGWQDMVMKDWILCFEFCISHKIQILQQRWIRIT